MPRIKVWLVVLVALLGVIPSLAQDAPPDYVIKVNNRAALSDDGSQIIIQSEVTNQGGDARDATTVRLIDLNNDANIASAQLRALESGETETIALSFSADRFEPDSRQPLRIEIISGSIRIKSLEVTIEIPQPAPEGVVVLSPAALEIPPLNIRVDLTDPVQVLVTAGIAGAVLVLVVILLVVLRLLFRRPPSFGTWQPPYINVPPMNPDTIAGRRQLWQQHAQNGALPMPCGDRTVHARKLLLGMDGGNLANWRIIALRMSQYDMYGRVARSQILAPKGLVKRLNRVVHKSRNQDSEWVMRQMRPVANRLAGQFKKKLNKRNAMLPIALDLRVQGAHGDVRIVFELYQCERGHWNQIDQWEPEMTVVSKTIYDSYTYTIYGQVGGETYKEFSKRLQEDLRRVLVDLTGTQPGRLSPDTLASAPPVEMRE